ncbi:hypothetical protein [Vibrio alginolyticus]|uniref:hypothetical protein n=1 Tax=Vibrio alginolyticus TaxID=663 RepID=UPI000AD97017|nr:hypothetical protein [Vibrio alginolyticus]
MSKSQQKIINLKIIIDKMLAEKQVIDNAELLGNTRLVSESKRKIMELKKELESI